MRKIKGIDVNQRDFEKAVETAVNWVAAEHKFFKDLQVDLQLLKKDIALAKEHNEVKDVKRALGDFRYIGKVERRFDNQEKNIEDFLKKLRDHELTASGSIHEIQQLLERLHTEAADLIKDSSLYDGKIRELLLHLKDEIKDHEIEQTQAVLMQIDELIGDAEKWIAAITVDLKTAKKIIQESNFDKSAEGYRDPNLEDFSNPHTLEKVKLLMEEHSMYGLHIWQHKHGSGVSGLYGHPDTKNGGARIEVYTLVHNGVLDIGSMNINCVKLVDHPQFDRYWHDIFRYGRYTMTSVLDDRIKFPTFKSYLTRFLEIIDDAVQGRSNQNVIERFRKEGLD